MQMSAWTLDDYRGSMQRGVLAAVVLPVVLVSLTRGFDTTLFLVRDERPVNYMDTFAPAMSAHLGADDVVVLTEAGKLPYWTAARVEEMIGLTNPHTALTPPSLGYLNALDPDVVMFNQAGTLDADKLVPAGRRQSPVVSLTPEVLESAVHDEFRSVYEQGLAAYDDSPLVGHSPRASF